MTILARAARLAGLAAVAFAVCGFTTDRRLDESSLIKPLPNEFRLEVVQGTVTPKSAQYRREGRVYLNDSFVPGGGAITSMLSAPWIAVHKTVDDAVIIEYPATDHLGRPTIRLDYALETAQNHFQLYRIDTNRLLSTLNEMESAARRGVSSSREIDRYNELVAIWNAHNARQEVVASDQFHIGSMEEIDTLIRNSRRLDDGAKLFTTTGDVIELYIR